MPAPIIPFSEQENAIIRNAFNEDCGVTRIVEKLNEMQCNVVRQRTNRSVVGQIDVLGLKRIVHKPTSIANIGKARAAKERQASHWTDCRKGDQRFKLAMLSAAKAGAEHIITGVFKDHRPSVGRFIHPDSVHSGCTSSAAMCAEMSAENDDIGELVFA